MTRDKEVASARWSGPLRRLVLVRGDWEVRAEQTRSLTGSPDKWDVYLAHDGQRVPPGPNLHASPGAEMLRLRDAAKLDDWDDGGGYVQ